MAKKDEEQEKDGCEITGKGAEVIGERPIRLHRSSEVTARSGLLIAIFEGEAARRPKSVYSAAKNHEDRETDKDESRENWAGGSGVEIDMPEAEDAKASGKGSNETAGIKTRVGSVSDGVRQTGRKVCARTEVAVKQHVTREEEERTSEATNAGEPSDAGRRIWIHRRPSFV